MSPDLLVFFAQSLGAGVLAGGIAYVIGRRGLLLLGLRCDSEWEDFSCSTAAGLGIIALAAFGLGTAGVLRPEFFAAVLAFLVLFSLSALRAGAPPPARPGEGTALHRTALIIVLLLAIPLLLLPLYPAHAPDAVTYHLAVAKKFATSGAVSPTPEFRYAVWPELAETLFACALLLGNDVTAQWMSFLALAVTAAAVAAYVRRVSGEPAGLWGAGLLLSNAAFLCLGAVAYGDMILTAFVTVAVLSFERWKEDGEKRWLAVSGFMAGCAAGTKYSALFFPPVLLVMIAAATGWRRGVRPVLMFLVPFAATALPWYLFNLYHTGNPVWPFFSGLFGTRYWNETDIAAQTSDLLSQYGSGKSLLSFFTLPWNLFAHGELFHAHASLSYLLIAGFPFALYAVTRDRSTRRLASVAAAYTIFWFFTAQILRYLIPVVPLYCAIAAAGAGQFLRRYVSRRFLPVGGALLAIVLFLPAAYFALRFAGAAGLPPSTPGERDRFLEKRLPSYGAVRFLNARAGNAYTLYSYHDPQMAYFADGEFRGDFFGPWRYSRIEGALEASEDTLLAALHDLGATYLLIRENDSGSGCREEWLTRRFVVPCYRSPGVALFRVSSAPLAPAYGPELVSPEDTAGKVSFSHAGIRVDVTEGRMYLLTCTGSAHPDFANAVLQMTWLDERGTRIRTYEASGVFLAKTTVLRLISTSPAHASAAFVALDPLGERAPVITRVSVREVWFGPGHF
jgi:4-amino-4-deoxy-L-arabinose transferase-like glycosyltransferase